MGIRNGDDFAETVLSTAFDVLKANCNDPVKAAELSKRVQQALRERNLTGHQDASAAFLQNAPSNVFNLIPVDGYCNEAQLTTHLDLLNLFMCVRKSVENRDGLFGVYNSYTKNDMSKVFDSTAFSFGEKLTLPFQIRWYIYISRAVERYTRWFDSLPASDVDPDNFQFLGGQASPITIDTLPPVDVLMVWHAHMLHPQMYWEDCIRSGRAAMFLHMPFPWAEISQVIRRASHAVIYRYIYDVPLSSITNFEALTGCAYENELDNISKFITCPHCYCADIKLNWCGAFHHGWAEEKFEHYCNECGAVINRDSLSAFQFSKDFKRLRETGFPLKGELSEYITLTNNQNMSNHGASKILLENIQKFVLEPGDGMNAIRRQIRQATERAARNMAKGSSAKYEAVDIMIRRLLRPYEYNVSKFGINLQAAVLREGRFGDIMNAYGYSVSPFRSDTINSTMVRFFQFWHLMRENPNSILVPPVDADFAWHTMQLNPSYYLSMCFVLQGTHVNHDDSATTTNGKCIQDALKATEKLWRMNFPQDVQGYSGCSCAFCEAERRLLVESNGELDSIIEKTGKKLLFGVSIDAKRRGAKIDEYYGALCDQAISDGQEEIVRLKSLTTTRAGIMKHPYLLFRPRDHPTMSFIYRHSTSVDPKDLEPILGPYYSAL
ncbi:uncharacterized protein V1518DRAFT_10796 [Limtongia smithiae]|uniref:uncharacterized protein n=1 Tax=Limtongia smithiae TaxID=1125753 RepID=UPI0034CEDC85